jgi:hypothetical protein
MGSRPRPRPRPRPRRPTPRPPQRRRPTFPRTRPRPVRPRPTVQPARPPARATARATTDTTDGTTGPVDDRLCPEHPATDACCCFAEAEQFEDYTENVCPTQPLCDTIQVLCDDFKLDTCAVDQLTTNSDAAIDCALQALVDGGVGSIEWSVSGTINPGQSGHQALLITVGDGTAFRTGYSYFDLGASVEAVARFMLPPKEFFLDCLTRPTAAERFVCLREGRIGMTIEGCLAAYDADYF